MMQLTKGSLSSKWNVVFGFLFALVLVVINIARIIRIPVTHDEVAFFSYLQSSSYSDIIHFKIVSANIHPLNFILTKFFTGIFSPAPFFLRLTSLLAQVIYLVYSFLLCGKLFKDKWWQISAFVCLNLNPFLFDFWALSRGYGLSLALMIASIYFLVVYFEQRKLLHLFAAFVLSAASVYSNFSLLNFYVAEAGVLLFYSILLTPVSMIRKYLPGELAVVVLASLGLRRLIAEPIRKLIDQHQLYHGGETGFFSDTLRSVIKESLWTNEVNSPVVTVIAWLVCVTVIAAAVYFLWSLFTRPKEQRTKNGVVFMLLLLLPVASVLLQHKLYETRFLLDRTALFFYLLYVVAVFYWLYCMANQVKIFSVVIVCLFTGLSVFNFSRNISLSTTWLWEYDKNDLVVLQRIVRESKGRKVILKSHLLFEPSLSYYVQERYSKNIVFQPGIGFPMTDTPDYCYVPIEDIPKLSPGYITDTAFTTRDTLFFSGKYALLKKQNTSEQK